MKIPKNVIFGCEAEKDKKRILAALKKDRLLLDVYLITLPEKNALLEIYPSYIFTKVDIYKKKNPKVVGIADGYDEAVDIVSTTILDCYNSQGDFDLKKYFISWQRKNLKER